MNIIRPSNAYCPGQLLHRIIPKTILSCLTNKKLKLDGGGKTKRSFLHSKDILKALNLLCFSAKVKNIYHFNSDEEISILELVNLICNEVNGKIPITYESLMLDRGVRS